LDAIGMNNEFPAGYFEYLDVVCTNTTSLSLIIFYKNMIPTIYSCINEVEDDLNSENERYPLDYIQFSRVLTAPKFLHL
jgi:hypothetical protein